MYRKKITALSVAVVIVMANLTGCGSYGIEDMSGASDTSGVEDMAQDAASGAADGMTFEPAMSDETMPDPETYEDYMELAEKSYNRQDWETAFTYYQGAKELDDSREEAYRGMSDVCLQMDDVKQALAILDEGIAKHYIDLHSQSASAQSSLIQRKEYVLAGTVAVRTKFIEKEYDDDGNNGSNHVVEYNEKGNEIKSVWCRAGGEVSNVIEHRYDGDGNQIEYEYKSYDSDGNISIFSHKTWAYDTDRKEIEYAEYDENGNMEKRTEYEYDANGNQIIERNYNKNDELVSRVETEYDAAGNEIKHMAYNKYGSCSLKIIREYDENSNEVKYVHYDDAATIDYWYEREYDENGNEVKYVHYDDAATINYWYEREYDENGNEIKYISYDDTETVSYWRECEYDDSGHQIKSVSYNSEGGISYMQEYEYDESGREIYRKSYNGNDIIIWTEQFEYAADDDGNIIKTIYTNYDWETGQKESQTVDEYVYDDNKNMTQYVRTGYDRKGETESRRWEREYDADGRKMSFSLYNNGKNASYQSKTEYDENGLMIKYTGYDKEGNVLVRKETEYNTSGKVIRETYYDADGNLVQYYETEYDDFGSIVRQAMYKDNILKSEKQISYTYHYIGNIDAEAADYTDNDITPEEYNLKQREIFTRFLEGQEAVCYRNRENSIEDGIIVRDVITDLVDFAYYRKNEKYSEYAFLDMTGDGIEELLIRCNLDRLYVIQYNCGVLKVICEAVEGNYGTYPVKWNGRCAVCCSYGSFSGMNREEYYFLDGKGKNQIFLYDSYQESQEDVTEGWYYGIYDNDSFGTRDISKEEYDDITDKMITEISIDWQKLEVPDYGND